jgi:hypothetical protein
LSQKIRECQTTFVTETGTGFYIRAGQQKEPIKGSLMTNEFIERRSKSRSIIDQYYSVEFSIRESAFVYQFKIWDISTKGISVLVKEDSDLLKHLKVGDILNLKYHKIDSPESVEFLRTKIRHISKDDTGRFKGVCLVGLSILEDQDSNQQGSPS